jgi:hypothetical protein
VGSQLLTPRERRPVRRETGNQRNEDDQQVPANFGSGPKAIDHVSGEEADEEVNDKRDEHASDDCRHALQGKVLHRKIKHGVPCMTFGLRVMIGSMSSFYAFSRTS